MATQNCPKCRQDSFTWTYDDDQVPTTHWSCRACGYRAAEDESFERVCNTCGTKTEIRLEDEAETYWWCSRCNVVNRIEAQSSK